MYDPEIYDHHCSMIIWSLSFIRSEQQSAIVGIVTSWTMTSCKYANNIKKNNNNNNKQINNWQCKKFLFQMWLYNCLFVVCCHKTVLYIIYKIMSHHQTRYDSYVFYHVSIHLVVIAPKNILSKIFGFLVFSRNILRGLCM